MYTIHFRNGQTIKFDPIKVKFFDPHDNPIRVSASIRTDPDCSKVTNQLNHHIHKNFRSKHPTNLRIVLGHACNFRCAYCSQDHKHLEKIPSEKIKAFADQLAATIQFDKLKIIQFWGGEPLLYWDEICELMDIFRSIHPTVGFSMVTNGSLMTTEIADRINNDQGFGFILSHDGPGQALRGIDPLRKGSKTREILLDMARRNQPKQDRRYVNEGRNFAINPVITTEVKSLVNLVRWYDEVFEGLVVPIAESIPVIPIQEGTQQYALHHDNLSAYTKMLYNDLLTLGIQRFDNYHLTLELFVQKLNLDDFEVNPTKALCFTTDPNMLTVDIDGNVLPCQTFGVEDILQTGEPANCGTLEDLKNSEPHKHLLKMPTVHGYKSREGKCEGCPVVSFCMGGCPYLVDGAHNVDCKVKYHHFLGLMMTYITILFGERILSIEKS